MEELSLVQVNRESIPEYSAAKLDPKWQEQMVLQYAPLIKYIASRLALRLPSHISMEDLISSGIIGLIDAVQKFDPSKNINFKTYAEFRIKGAMLDELRSLDWIPRSVRKKTHLIEDAYAKLQRSLGRPAEAEEVAEFMDLEIGEFYKLLDETKTVSVVALEEGRKNLVGMRAIWSMRSWRLFRTIMPGIRYWQYIFPDSRESCWRPSKPCRIKRS